jgi:hypothetical protein
MKYYSFVRTKRSSVEKPVVVIVLQTIVVEFVAIEVIVVVVEVLQTFADNLH